MSWATGWMAEELRFVSRQRQEIYFFSFQIVSAVHPLCYKIGIRGSFLWDREAMA
jgi:hypothetical protein